MDFRGMIFIAARDGDLKKLKEYLSSQKRNADDIKSLVHSKTGGATPLVMAAKNGHAEVVQYLVDYCHADVEYAGSVNFDGETIDGAPPLWCAAAAGHVDIVKFLIKKTANVNSTTLTNSTPLRAACFDGHFDIVRYLVENNADIEIANRHGHTCLMISCYKGHINIVQYLLNKGADVNRKSIKGNTALHDCAESGSLDIMKLLLEHNAQMDKDAYGMTPLFAAAVTGHTTLVEYLIGRDKIISPIERIEALELLGATYVDKKRDMASALRYWRRALVERNINPLHPMKKPLAASRVAAYEGAKEVQTIDELNELISDPDDMRMQALLVRERILGPAHPDTSYYIRYRGAVYADLGNFERCIALWMYALEMQMDKLDPLSPMTHSSLLSFAELFSFMMGSGRARSVVKFTDICDIFSKAIIELERGHKLIISSAGSPGERELNNYSRIVLIIMHLMSLICRLSPKLTSEQSHQFKQLVFKLVRLDPRTPKGQTLLHMAASLDTTEVGKYPVCTFPCLNCVELLVEMGANLNSVDLNGCTPLHTACSKLPISDTILLALLNAGTHIDRVDNEGKCALELITSASVLKDITSSIMPHNFISLKCLAAKAVKQNKIRYRNTPKELQVFTDGH